MNSALNLARDRSWIFCSAEKESLLRPLCQRVEAQFQLPKTRLCRYFADSDDAALSYLYGAHFRGFHAPFSARRVLPIYLIQCFFHAFDPSRDVPFEDTIAFDSLIYIRHSTCDDTTGFVTTYAHELQHVIQRANMPRLLVVNEVLYQDLKAYEPTIIATDIPHEREANIVSKRIAEIVCGIEAVKVFAEAQTKVMRSAGDYEQEARWNFFRDVPSSTQFDLLRSTLPFTEKYKHKLDFGIDVNKPNWWIGPLEDRSSTDEDDD